ncbi:MAG TPA: hypothetical protein PK079_25510 [Leptospiraceae bacterium]|nr:hypothetical protein [Leptospiraceae bacterium]HMW05258.1 hypothetical protein [Leptospiraceae bacterium]HMX31277.1 hypothetical protein [Leptospiraceae bacterium]HMY32083.1 hypothetical protein [Leptospiraceae bacterium]HMZ67324.1 hypothetical protein [Leptospiraceae bacterium]
MSSLNQLFNLLKASTILGTGSLAGSFAIIVDGVNVKFKFDFGDFHRERTSNTNLSSISEDQCDKVRGFFESIKRNITEKELRNYYAGIKDIKIQGKTLEHVSYVICHTGLTILKATNGKQQIIDQYEAHYKKIKK